MSFGAVHTLTANGDWLEMIWPIVLVAIYGAGAIVKMFVERSNKDKHEEAEEPSQAAASQRRSELRYKPLGEPAGPRPETPQSRTLPYARTAGRSEPTLRPSAPAAQPAEVMSDWDRQQAIKQRRQEQIEALRRQQQRQQILQQQRQQQQAAAQRVRSQGASPRGGAGPQAVRKAPQEARRQVQSARAAATSVLSRHSVLKKGPAAAAQTALQAAGATPPAASGVDRLWKMLRSRDSLRTAMVLREILDKPLAMRE